MQHHPHRVEETLELDCPVDQCYKALIGFERYPAFISGLQVKRKGDEEVWQWTLKGAEGQEIAWDMALDGMRHENRTISWHSIRLADVSHNGAITLEPLGDNRTRLNFVVEYEPSAGFYEAAPRTQEPQFSDEKFVQRADQAIRRSLKGFQSFLKAGQPR